MSKFNHQRPQKRFQMFGMSLRMPNNQVQNKPPPSFYQELFFNGRKYVGYGPTPILAQRDAERKVQQAQASLNRAAMFDQRRNLQAHWNENPWEQQLQQAPRFEPPMRHQPGPYGPPAMPPAQSFVPFEQNSQLPPQPGPFWNDFDFNLPMPSPQQPAPPPFQPKPTMDQVLYKELHATPNQRQAIKCRMMKHNQRIRKSAISDLSAAREVAAQGAEQQQADRMRKMVLEKYMEAMKGRLEYMSFKVIAGFVMERAGGQLEVVSVATGTKTVHGEYLSRKGAAINDSHAEILARRGLISFFFAELMKLIEGKDSIFFLPAKENADKEDEFDSIQLYKLKEGTKFHLYISKSPCGDACNYSPHETQTAKEARMGGKLRTKIEGEEGTKVVPDSGATLTWDGLLGGQKLLTMSCSDKVAKWNVLGLQGCLLAALIEPIYLSSIAIGSKLKKAHIERAIAGRLDSLTDVLAAPFKLNRPEVFQTTQPDPRNLSATAHCVNWTRHHNSVEILAGFTGRPLNEKEGVSRLSKQSFMKAFKDLVAKFPEGELKEELSFASLNYSGTKNQVIGYQSTKQLFLDTITECGMGTWVRKPEEQNEFY